MTFFSHRPQILNFPLFSLFRYIPPVSRKLLFPLLLSKFPPVFEKFTFLLHAFSVFRFPLLWPWCIYASPNARTGRPCFHDHITPAIQSLGYAGLVSIRERVQFKLALLVCITSKDQNIAFQLIFPGYILQLF